MDEDTNYKQNRIDEIETIVENGQRQKGEWMKCNKNDSFLRHVPNIWDTFNKLLSSSLNCRNVIIALQIQKCTV